MPKAKKPAGKTAKTSKTKTKAVEAEIVDGDAKALAPVAGPLSTHDPFALYMAEVRKYPLLTPEKEREVAMKYYETKDPKAAELLVTSNLRFVVKIAAEYSKFGARMIDLVQEGNVGLMHAVREFNPYKGVKLITYAVWWIRGYIQEYLMRQYSMVRIGTTQNQRKLFYQLQQERRKLEALGHQSGVQLLSSRLGIPEDEITDMDRRMSNRDLSLDQPLDDQSKATLLDVTRSSTEEGADEQLGNMEEITILQEKIDAVRPTLNEKELYILENRLLSDSPLTLQEIGDKYGMTRERARQLEARIISKIRDTFDSTERE